jgi:hypothetical protein
MNARPSTSGLPSGLNYDKSTNRYVLRLINGKRKTLGSNKYKAIALANAYNAKMRPELSLQALTSPNDRLIPFDAIQDKIFSRESLSRDIKRALINDMNRAREYFTVSVDCIDRKMCNDYLEKYHSNLKGESLNKKISFLKKLFNYVVDAGLMQTSPAATMLMDKKLEKKRKRLTLEQYKAIHELSPLWLQTAMDLSLQTTHARLEVLRIEYRLKTMSTTRNGCVWLDTPQNGLYGTLYINRQKVLGNEEAHVAIPIGSELKRIIDNSKDKVLCPFVVHRIADKRRKVTSQETTHINQVAPDYLSTQFRKYRDETGLFDDMKKEERPTFHEIRALSAYLFKKQGIDPKSRMAHKDARSTKVYTDNHTQFVEVPHAEIMV